MKKIEEMVVVKVTAPNAKERSRNDYWNYDKRPKLRAAIEKCLADGTEQFVEEGQLAVFHVRPMYPLIESAMAEPENADYLKVYISVYFKAFSLGVKESNHVLAASG